MRQSTKTIYRECDRIAESFKHNAVIRKCEKSANWRQTWGDIFRAYVDRVQGMWEIAETAAAEERIRSCTAFITSMMHDAEQYMVREKEILK